MSIEQSETAKYWMALGSVRSVGAKTAQRLVDAFGSPEGVISASVDDISRLPKISSKLAYEIIEKRNDLKRFEKLVAWMSNIGIKVLCPDNAEYPYLLKLTQDPPCILYKKGAELPNNKPIISIVGTCYPTSEGIDIAEKISSKLSGDGFVIASGLARGIDTAAHKGAINANGKTIAVIGSGLKKIYPKENCHLAEEILNNGVILSECHLNEIVSKQRLLQRNRITSGIASAIILIEPESGSLNTAQWALKYGRPVFLYGNQKNSVSFSHDFLYHIDGLDELGSVTEVLQNLPHKSDMGQMSLF